MTCPSAIVFDSLDFAYEGNNEKTLRGVSMEIARGEYVVIAGPSGAGKSTFCRTLNNIIPLFYRGKISGKRMLAGEQITNQSIASLAKKVGMVFQEFEQQLFSTSSRLDLTFALENFKVPRTVMLERVEEIAERLGIVPLLDREPSTLSGGEKQKLAIASVLIYRPEILVLDEPTTDLDPESRDLILQMIPALKDWIETLIVIDHETEYFTGANRIFLFSEGSVRASGKAEEILTDSNLLIANSLAPLDLVQLQKKLGDSPRLIGAEQLSHQKALSVKKWNVPARSTSAAVIQVEGLTFRYKDYPTPALSDISFEIREGEFVGIIGQNGSGKSTLVRHLNGLCLPQQGTVRILGREVRQWNRKELAQKVGLVFQNPDHQIFESTVKAEVEFGPRQFGFPPEQLQSSVARALETMDLTSQKDRDPFQLSKGERQRVAVASVLSVKPQILILDEPTTGLDWRQQNYMMQLLCEFNASGITVIIITHAWKLVGQYCNYCLLLKQGRLVAEGHPRKVFFELQDLKLPPLLELSRRVGGNAMTVEEF